MIRLLLTGLFLLILQQLSAQTDRGCTSDVYWQRIRNADPSILTRERTIELKTRKLVSQAVENLSANDQQVAPRKIIIPVVVHVLYKSASENISDDQILSQIESLNKDFNKLNQDISNVPIPFAGVAADCGIEFKLASVDPDGRATTGIERKQTSVRSWKDDDKMKFSSQGGLDAWDSQSYLNIWVCNSDYLLGYATKPGGDVKTDGVVIKWNAFGTRGNLNFQYSKGRTTTHEVGHWLNLKHLWGESDCGNDEVDDTPQQRTYNRGCPSFPHISSVCNNGPYGDMFMNFMDFSDDACLIMFTEGQKQRMQALFEVGGPRASLLESKALGLPWNLTPKPSESEVVVSVVNELKVYPNPTGQWLNLKFTDQSQSLDGKDFLIFSRVGRTVMQGTIKGEMPRLDVSQLPSGVYYIRIGEEKVKWTETFIKL
jgi:Pregnancy-associated plasma protein-A/Secretion system C-terminal sorting domain